MKQIRIEGQINDADTSEPIKDIQVMLVMDREVLSQFLTGSDGKYLLEVRKAKPGDYEIQTREAEGGFRYAENAEAIHIDSLPFQTQIDFSLM